VKSQVKILIADDHEIVREGLKAALSSVDEWQICAEASTGREAVAKALLHAPDVVVMDFSMPELNGLEATRQIRQALPQTEVLILSMHNSERLVHELITAGAKGFILKSDTKRFLTMAVEALSARQTFFTPSVSSMILNGYLNHGFEAQNAQHSSERLTPREREIVQLIAEGKTSKEIANLLGASEKTVDTHRANILRRLNLRSAIDLVRYAIRNDIISP
jgi:DNA-binding NarL/FixJ family response regulator